MVDEVEVKLAFAPRGQVGQPTQFKVTLRNAGRSRKLGLLLQWDAPDWCDRETGVHGVYQPRLEPGEEVAFTLVLQPRLRGDRRLEGLRLCCSYPFGFFPRSRALPVAAPILIIPRTDRTELKDRLSRLPGLGNSGVQPNRKGRSQEFRALRDYRQGEDLRYVHWPTSSRVGRLMLKEYMAPAQTGVRLVVDNREPETEDQGESFETMVEQLAGWLYWSRRNGVLARVFFLQGEGWAEMSSQDSGALEALARLPFALRCSDQEWLGKAAGVAMGGQLIGWRRFETPGLPLWTPVEVAT